MSGFYWYFLLLIYENKRLQVEISEFLGGCTRSAQGNRVNRNWKKAKILTDEEQFDEFTIWILKLIK